MKRFIFITVLTITALILVACGNDDDTKDEGNTEQSIPSTEITEEEKVAEDKVVAVINGTEVTGDIYNLIYAQLKLQSVQMEEEYSLDELKEATIDSLIDQEIVFQDAKEEGIVITKDEAQSEFNVIKEENGDDLETLLDQYQITEDGFKENIRFELTMNQYLKDIIKVEVTDEEVKEAYDEVKAEANEDEEIPEFEDVKDQIERNMHNEKVRVALQEKVDKIKETADIERKI